MAAKTFFVICAYALLIQTISARVICPKAAAASARRLPSGASCGRVALAPVAVGSGGSLVVSSASALAPNGISIVSRNEIQGVLDVAGRLPFLGAVALQGEMPSAGTAGVAYSCGNGNVGIIGERAGAGGVAPLTAAGNRVTGARSVRPGCGRRVLY